MSSASSVSSWCPLADLCAPIHRLETALGDSIYAGLRVSPSGGPAQPCEWFSASAPKWSGAPGHCVYLRLPVDRLVLGRPPSVILHSSSFPTSVLISNVTSSYIFKYNCGVGI